MWICVYVRTRIYTDFNPRYYYLKNNEFWDYVAFSHKSIFTVRKKWISKERTPCINVYDNLGTSVRDDEGGARILIFSRVSPVWNTARLLCISPHNECGPATQLSAVRSASNESDLSDAQVCVRKSVGRLACTEHISHGHERRSCEAAIKARARCYVNAIVNVSRLTELVTPIDPTLLSVRYAVVLISVFGYRNESELL